MINGCLRWYKGFVEKTLTPTTRQPFMQTECTANALQFQAVAGRAVRALFDGGTLTSDGGAVLLREVDRATGVLRRFAACFTDHRDPARVTHSVAALVRQRVYALALGYEDLNDHEQLRRDPVLAVLAEAEDLTAPLAGKSTLNRLALSAAAVGGTERYKKITVDPCGDRPAPGHAVPRGPCDTARGDRARSRCHG